ncbi:squalene/phytoene synthase family protein [Pseudomonas sp. PCH446]
MRSQFTGGAGVVEPAATGAGGLARPRQTQQAAIVQCLRVMCPGMGEFQRVAGLQGLESLAELKRYCYCVAGVVGEMFTELFVDFAPELAVHQARMTALAPSFGEGLQLTNILKDQWRTASAASAGCHGTCLRAMAWTCRRYTQARSLVMGRPWAN